MSNGDQMSLEMRAAYRAGAVAARSGRMMSCMPTYCAEDLTAAWRNGWTDAALAVGMIGTDWRADLQVA